MISKGRHLLTCGPRAAEWRRIELPRPAFPGRGAYDSLTPLQMFAVGDEVWVLAYYHARHPLWGNRVDRGVLLSNVYRKPCDVNHDARCAGPLARYQ